jgi:hypothetical protein
MVWKFDKWFWFQFWIAAGKISKTEGQKWTNSLYSKSNSKRLVIKVEAKYSLSCMFYCPFKIILIYNQEFRYNLLQIALQ